MHASCADARNPLMAAPVSPCLPVRLRDRGQVRQPKPIGGDLARAVQCCRPRRGQRLKPTPDLRDDGYVLRQFMIIKVAEWTVPPAGHRHPGSPAICVPRLAASRPVPGSSVLRQAPRPPVRRSYWLSPLSFQHVLTADSGDRGQRGTTIARAPPRRTDGRRGLPSRSGCMPSCANSSVRCRSCHPGDHGVIPPGQQDHRMADRSQFDNNSCCSIPLRP